MNKYSYQRDVSHKKMFLALFLLGTLLGIWIGYYISFQTFQPGETVVETKYVYKTLSNYTSYFAEINLAAVDKDGNGVTTPLIVEAKPGDGKILTNIEKLLFWVDTQQSMQIAKHVAEDLTSIDVEKYDLTYTIKSNATLVGGPSAGAALTVATIAALENKKVKDDVMMTGTINPDGTIGEVGGILEKAKAAKDLGMTLFLVPKGQGTQTYYKPEESCEKISNFIFCKTKYKEITINISKEIGIDVIEVENVSSALKYLLF